MKKNEDTLRKEYPAELIKSGQRGKYAAACREGNNIVLIAPELRRLFPDSDAVNRALRNYAQEHNMALT
jgi:hypothetical protein